jgi:hypothetical protein
MNNKYLKCGDSSSGLHIHHINQIHSDNSPDNLVCLCSACHLGLHRNRWSLTDIPRPYPKQQYPTIKSIFNPIQLRSISGVDIK